MPEEATPASDSHGREGSSAGQPANRSLRSGWKHAFCDGRHKMHGDEEGDAYHRGS